MSFRIGVDGGGTKTECILLDEHGTAVAVQTAPGCNPSLLGPERARQVLADALRALLAKAPPGSSQPEIAATLLCMAGSASFWIATTTAEQEPVLGTANSGNNQSFALELNGDAAGKRRVWTHESYRRQGNQGYTEAIRQG